MDPTSRTPSVGSNWFQGAQHTLARTAAKYGGASLDKLFSKAKTAIDQSEPLSNTEKINASRHLPVVRAIDTLFVVLLQKDPLPEGSVDKNKLNPVIDFIKKNPDAIPVKQKVRLFAILDKLKMDTTGLGALKQQTVKEALDANLGSAKIAGEALACPSLRPLRWLHHDTKDPGYCRKSINEYLDDIVTIKEPGIKKLLLAGALDALATLPLETIEGNEGTKFLHDSLFKIVQQTTELLQAAEPEDRAAMQSTIRNAYKGLADTIAQNGGKEATTVTVLNFYENFLEAESSCQKGEQVDLARLLSELNVHREHLSRDQLEFFKEYLTAFIDKTQLSPEDNTHYTDYLNLVVNPKISSNLVGVLTRFSDPKLHSEKGSLVLKDGSQLEVPTQFSKDYYRNINLFQKESEYSEVTGKAIDDYILGLDTLLADLSAEEKKSFKNQLFFLVNQSTLAEIDLDIRRAYEAMTPPVLPVAPAYDLPTIAFEKEGNTFRVVMALNYPGKTMDMDNPENSNGVCVNVNLEVPIDVDRFKETRSVRQSIQQSEVQPFKTPKFTLSNPQGLAVDPKKDGLQVIANLDPKSRYREVLITHLFGANRTDELNNKLANLTSETLPQETDYLEGLMKKQLLSKEAPLQAFEKVGLTENDLSALTKSLKGNRETLTYLKGKQGDLDRIQDLEKVIEDQETLLALAENPELISALQEQKVPEGLSKLEASLDYLEKQRKLEN